MVLGSAITALAYVASKTIGKLTSKSENRFAGDDFESGTTTLKKSERNINGANPDYRGTDYSNAKTQKMYKDLGMTDNQRRRYEADYSAVMEEWEKKNPNSGMDEAEKADQHNKALNAVLDEAQYAMYRDWSRDNPNAY